MRYEKNTQQWKSTLKRPWTRRQSRGIRYFFPSFLSVKKKTLNQKQDNEGKSIGRTGSVVRIVQKGKKVARALRAFSSIAWPVSTLLRWR